MAGLKDNASLDVRLIFLDCEEEILRRWLLTLRG